MNPIQNLSGLPFPLEQVQPSGKSEVEITTDSFSNVLKSMVDNTNNSQLSADKAIQNLQSGKAEHLHEVMLAVEQADISMRMLVQIRNRALTAYEELMRMQI